MIKLLHAQLLTKSVFFRMLVVPVLLPAAGTSQEGSGDTIAVNTAVVVELVFKDPSEGTVENGDGSYSIKGGSRTSLLVTARKEAAPTQTMIVKEGSRTHRFTLIYQKDALPARHDYANLQPLPASNQPTASAPKTVPAVIVGDKRMGAKDKALVEQWLKEGNEFFNRRQWDSARSRYNNVLPYKGRHLASVQQKLKEIAVIQDNQAKEKEAAYADAMRRARSLMQAQQYRDAHVAVLQALALKSGDPEAQQMATALKPLLEKLAQEEKAALVQDHLRKADLAAKAKHYLESEEWLLAAIRLEPNNIVVAKKMKELGDKPKIERYQVNRAKGDSLYKAKTYELAQKAYELALQARPKDAYVLGQLKKVNQQQRILLQQQQYRQAIANADKAFAAGELKLATSEYQRAIRIFPDSTYPVKQLASINTQRKTQLQATTVKQER